MLFKSLSKIVPNLILRCLNSFANRSSSSRSTFSSAGKSSLPTIVWWLGMSRGDIGRWEENGEGEREVRGGGDEEHWDDVFACDGVKAGVSCSAGWLEVSKRSFESCLWRCRMWTSDGKAVCWPFDCDKTLADEVWENKKCFSCCCKFCCCCWSANWMVWTSNCPMLLWGRSKGLMVLWRRSKGPRLIGRSPFWVEAAASTAATAIWLCQRAFCALKVES